MNKQGFTLIEILIVLSVVAFLSTTLFVGFENYTQRSVDLKARNSVIDFINKSQNYINFENWKDSPNKKLIFKMNENEFSLKDSENKEIYSSLGFEEFDLKNESLEIEFENKSTCSFVGGANEKSLAMFNKENIKALEVFSNEKNCYLEILKI